MIIPSNDYVYLKKQQPLEKILNDIYNQIDIIKSHPHFNSKNVRFELEFRLQNKYTNIDVEEFVNNNSYQYFEYLLKENQSTKYRIICNSKYNFNNKENLDINNKDIKDGTIDNNLNRNEKCKSSKLLEYITSKCDKEISINYDNYTEFTKKLTLITAYYFVYKIALNIEISSNTDNILNYLKIISNNGNKLKEYYNKESKEITILNYTEPILKKRRSFIMNHDVQVDVTYYNENNQFEIDFSKNIYHDRLDMIRIVNNIMQTIDISGFIIDYLFMLLPNFEFQKPITPSLDILFKNGESLVKDSFFVSAKTDGIRKLILVINNRIYSITENFSVEFINEIEGNFHLILDCEFINNIFIPFDALYNETDLRSATYKERVSILNSLDYRIFKNKIVKKNIKYCKEFQDIQIFIVSELDNTIPNDGIIITNGTSTYFDNIKVYKIKTVNTVDIEFNGRYFLAREHRVNKSILNLSVEKYKNICKLYNKFKIQNTTEKNYYSKKIEVIDNEKIVKYYRLKSKSFIIEYDLDNKEFIKVRNDKAVSNSINTFNSILLASYQKINIDIFLPKSNVLMRKYHNIIKQNILCGFKGSLLDIGSGNGGDIHKWNHFRKITCVEPNPEKLKNLNKRISNSEIKNRIKVIPNNIQEATLNDNFDIATCFFSLNDMTYTDISKMLNNIKKNINKTFIVLFFDYSLFNENITSHSLTYQKCIINKNNKIINTIDKASSTYLLSWLRYSHNECDNIMYINILDSNVVNHYECGINSAKVINIFKENGFELKNQYSIENFPLLNEYQNKYSSFLKVIEFLNTNIK